MQITHPDSTWFTQDRLGMFIHWGLYSLGARHEWLKNREYMTNEEYQKYFDHFNPDLYNPKEWAQHAKNAGMKYVVLTTKHHEGFCLWDSQYTDYKSTNTPYGKDLLRPFVDAFREAGLKIGFYYSLLDWHHPEYTVDSRHPLAMKEGFNSNVLENKNVKVNWPFALRPDPSPEYIACVNKNRDMRKYAEYMRNQVTELLTEFGRIDVLWFDFSFPEEKFPKTHLDWESEKLYELIRKLQPHVMIDNRLDIEGSGDFITPEQFQPHSSPGAVWEACQTLSGSWGYHRDELTWKSTNQLLWMLIDGVSKGGNLLLNVGPTSRGEFDYRAQERLEDMGRWIKYHARSIYGCGSAPEEFPIPSDCRYTYNPHTKCLYLHVLQWPFERIIAEKLQGKVEYMQFLHDGSEVLFDSPSVTSHEINKSIPGDSLILHLPIVKPNAEIPVIEIFLKK